MKRFLATIVFVAAAATNCARLGPQLRARGPTRSAAGLGDQIDGRQRDARDVALFPAAERPRAERRRRRPVPRNTIVPLQNSSARRRARRWPWATPSSQFRYLFPTGQPIGPGKLWLRAWGYDITTGVTTGVVAQTLLNASNAWQETTVRFDVPTIPAGGLGVRAGLVFDSCPSGIFAYLDEVFLQGSSMSFGSLELPPVGSPFVEANYVVESSTIRIEIDAYSGAMVLREKAVGGNYLALTALSTFLLHTNIAGHSDVVGDDYNYSIIRKTTSGTLATLTLDTTKHKSGLPAAIDNIAAHVTIQADQTYPDMGFWLNVENTNTVSGDIIDNTPGRG